MKNKRQALVAWCVPESSFSFAEAQQLLSAHGFVVQPLDLAEPMNTGAELVVLHSGNFLDLEALRHAYDRLSKPSLIVVKSADEESKVYQWPDLPLTMDVCRADSLRDQIAGRLLRLWRATGQGLEANEEQKVHPDPAASIHNRAYLGERLAREVANAFKHCRSLSIALIELDQFEQITQTFGSALSDETFQVFAGTALTNIRIVDWLAYHGEHRLCLVMPDTWLEEGRQVVERIREAIAAKKIAPIEKHCPRLSLSIGVAELTDNEADYQALLHKARVALLRAINEGGNRVCIEVS